MAIQKKSLIGNLSATKKAIVATNVASTAPASAPKLETAKKGHKGNFAKEGHRAYFAKRGAIRFEAGKAAMHPVRTAKTID